MKVEKDRSGAFRWIVGLVIDNWGLKILAFILAVVIYYAMKPTDDANVPSERIKFEKVVE